MLKNKLFNLFFIALLVFGIYSVVGAHSSNYNGMMGNGYNNGYPDYDEQGYYGMMGYYGMGMMGNGGMMNMMGYGDNMMNGFGPGLNNNTDFSLSALGLTEVQVKQMVVELVDRQFGSDYRSSAEKASLK